MGSTTVLVTDGNQRAALAAVRALGAEGFRVLVTSEAPPFIAGASRYTTAEFQLRDPLAMPAEYASALAELCAVERVDVVLPATEASMLCALDCSVASLVPPPTHRSFTDASDKEGLVALPELSRYLLYVTKLRMRFKYLAG
jgi:hypothetical protein